MGVNLGACHPQSGGGLGVLHDSVVVAVERCRKSVHAPDSCC